MWPPSPPDHKKWGSRCSHEPWVQSICFAFIWHPHSFGHNLDCMIFLNRISTNMRIFRETVFFLSKTAFYPKRDLLGSFVECWQMIIYWSATSGRGKMWVVNLPLFVGSVHQCICNNDSPTNIHQIVVDLLLITAVDILTYWRWKHNDLTQQRNDFQLTAISAASTYSRKILHPLFFTATIMN